MNRDTSRPWAAPPTVDEPLTVARPVYRWKDVLREALTRHLEGRALVLLGGGGAGAGVEAVEAVRFLPRVLDAQSSCVSVTRFVRRLGQGRSSTSGMHRHRRRAVIRHGSPTREKAGGIRRLRRGGATVIAATWYSVCGSRHPAPDARISFACALAPWSLIPGVFGLIAVASAAPRMDGRPRCAQGCDSAAAAQGQEGAKQRLSPIPCPAGTIAGFGETSPATSSASP